MTALLYILGVLLFAVGVAASIGLHEMGHLIPGKLFDVKVTQYFVGFGRTIWSTRSAARPSTASRRSRSAATASSSGCSRRSRDQDPSKVRDSRTGMFAQLVSDAALGRVRARRRRTTTTGCSTTSPGGSA